MSKRQRGLKASWQSRRVRGAILLFFVATILLCAGVLLARGLGWGNGRDDFRAQIFANLKREHRGFVGLVDARLPRNPTTDESQRSYDLEIFSELLAQALQSTGSDTLPTALLAADGSILWKKNYENPDAALLRKLVAESLRTQSEAYSLTGNALMALSPVDDAYIFRQYPLPSDAVERQTKFWERLSLFAGLMGLIVAVSLLVSWVRLRFPSANHKAEAESFVESNTTLSNSSAESRESLILALNLRNLLSLYDLLAPEVLVTVLDEFWRRVHLGLENSGAEFIGRPSECLVAVWPNESTRTKLVHETMMKLSRDLDEMNAGLKERGLPTLQWGLALHAGRVKRTLWRYPDHRRELGFLGSPIHETLRMCTLTRENEAQLLISETALSHLANPKAFTKSGEAWLKGRALQLYTPMRRPG